MSYLSEYRRGHITLRQALSKSAAWVARQSGRVMSDDDITVIERHADEFTDTVEPALVALITAAFPQFPPGTVSVLAARAAQAALESVDTAVSAAGAFVKEHNEVD